MKKEKRYWKKYWPNRWAGGKFYFIPHNLLLGLSVTLAYILKQFEFLGWISFFTHTYFLFEAFSVELIWL